MKLSLIRIVDIANDKKVAAVLDQSPANLIHLKLNINEKDRILAGEKLTKLYTNKSFSADLGATASVSIYFNRRNVNTIENEFLV